LKRVAVIGSGISGLAAAYYLSRRHEVFLFEKEDRLGGHTHTVEVEGSRGRLAIDTGFIVHNDRTYPNLVRLLGELGVATQPSDMSFAVSCRKTGFEYSSHGLGGFFAQRSNFLRQGHYRLLIEILRFSREAPKVLQPGAGYDLTLGDFLQQGKYSSELIERYLVPMASAVWSTSPENMRAFPAVSLIQFFANHGMLGINTHPKWKVLRGGSRSYIYPMTAPYRERIFLNSHIRTIRRGPDGVMLLFREQSPMNFDEVVMACHGDQVLPLLESPSDAERDVLGAFQTTRNEVQLHTDTSLLPRRAAARASWNYNLNLAGAGRVTLTYHMNRLQSLAAPEDYCLTLNGTDCTDPVKVLLNLVYNHPLYTRESLQAQSRWEEISGRNRTHFCGAYWFYGFHEDGLNSALRVAAALGVRT